jgi:hypothetical protein
VVAELDAVRAGRVETTVGAAKAWRIAQVGSRQQPAICRRDESSPRSWEAQLVINVELEPWLEGGPRGEVTRVRSSRYRRIPVDEFRDHSAALTPRQAVFYRNLIRIAVAIGSSEIPVDFELANGDRVYFDRGCIRIAALAGFIQPLENSASSGVVEMIRISWTC